ncbi:MAG: hypothetical protein PHR94_08250 [Methylomonas lenta]|nr:hypothetical protein [Methylomonas lenta]
MNPTQVKCLFVFTILAIIGFGPVSPTCLIGLYIVIERPRWFFTLLGNLYERQPPLQDRVLPETKKQTRRTRIKCCLSLLALLILDIAPIPVTALIAFPVILNRPLWFVRIAASVYGKDLKTS